MKLRQNQEDNQQPSHDDDQDENNDERKFMPRFVSVFLKKESLSILVFLMIYRFKISSFSPFLLPITHHNVKLSNLR